ncbi:Starch-binding associating with outer membrane [Parapedobacter composti]|uniref:Starch-binding associating with outer membrane n=1 Tax=Parapedobacter composti TaxID=623281 RepID=A0A1I1KEU8_9SPHI|nr:SusD/RagB family nutrient-binding outer membrane lipoprotein [Parapedobacter composti]SFC59329.1 Starch-binding associating with outer membrane [Parapedobacter composti]
MKKLKIVCVIGLLVTVSGCKKFLDINTNPTNPQVIKAEIVLPPIIYQMANGVSQDNRILMKISQAMFGTSGDFASQVWERHGYPGGVSDVGGVTWRMVYVDHGLNLEEMIADAVNREIYDYAGIGYAIKAWGYQWLTDMHGPIILDHAYTPGMLAFPYQDQPEVYARVREWVDESLRYFNMQSRTDMSGVLAGPSGDFLYRGNIGRWRRFLYGLLAMQYSRLVNKPEFSAAYADSVIKYVDLSFTSSEDDAMVRFNGNESSDSNPYGPQAGYLNSTYYGRVSNQIVRYLTGGMRGTPVVDTTASDDPRLTRMLSPRLSDSVYVGGLPFTANSTTIPHAMGNTLEGKYIFQDAAGFPIMTYAELQFLKAEALYHKGDLEKAYEAYLQGIRGHMDFINRYGLGSGSNASAAISEAEIQHYLNSEEVAQNAGELTLADIVGQKYVALWGWGGLEQWTDMRKYHYDPAIFRNYNYLTAGQLYANNNGRYAYRIRPRYNSEYVWNVPELEKWGGLELDYMTHELWFSKSDE